MTNNLTNGFLWTKHAHSVCIGGSYLASVTDAGYTLDKCIELCAKTEGCKKISFGRVYQSMNCKVHSAATCDSLYDYHTEWKSWTDYAVYDLDMDKVLA